HRLDLTLAHLREQAVAHAVGHEEIQLVPVVDLERIRRVSLRVGPAQLDQAGAELGAQALARGLGQSIHVGEQMLALGTERAEHRVAVVVGFEPKLKRKNRTVACDAAEFPRRARLGTEAVHTPPWRQAQTRNKALTLDRK